MTSSKLSKTYTHSTISDQEKIDSNKNGNFDGHSPKHKLSQDLCDSDLKSNSPLPLPKTVLISSEKDHCLDAATKKKIKENDTKKLSPSSKSQLIVSYVWESTFILLLASRPSHILYDDWFELTNQIPQYKVD